jgi:hypothetical protein
MNFQSVMPAVRLPADAVELATRAAEGEARILEKLGVPRREVDAVGAGVLPCWTAAGRTTRLS